MASRTSPQYRGTARDSSDVRGLIDQWALANHAWVLNAALAVNTTQFSVANFQYLNSGGTLINVTATATGGNFTGITVATGCYALAAAYITQAGTMAIAVGTTAATYAGVGMPSVPATAVVYGLIVIRPSTASAFTGGTTVLDGTNASCIFAATNGPSALVLQTAPLTVSPG